MNRHRLKLEIQGLTPDMPVVARAADDAPEPDWYETVTSDVMNFRCSDAEDRVVFDVELFQPAIHS